MARAHKPVQTAPPHDLAPSLRVRLFEILEHGRRRDSVARTLDWFLIALVLANVGGVIVQSVPGIAPDTAATLQRFDRICVVVFALEYAARLWVAPEHPFGRNLSTAAARWRTARSPLMVIDGLALVPFLLELIFPGQPLVRLTRLVRFLKLARYSPALATIGRVIAAERRALMACLIIISGALLTMAAVMMSVEGHLQPQRLGDMPKAMWWAASMLAKIGGGELEPMTAAGRMVAAVTVMLGIFCFALPVAILGRGFYEEIRRRDFVVTFAMVARVPLFEGLEAGALAEVVGTLKARTVPAGTTIVRRGERGDAMYMIAAGNVEVTLPDGATRTLGTGDFFGEMALLTREPRSATITSLTTVDLLVVDAADFHRLAERMPEVHDKVERVARSRSTGSRSG